MSKNPTARNHIAKRIISLFLTTIIVITMLFSMSACKRDREFDAAAVETAAAELLKRSQKLNEIYYGYGIGYIDDLSQANGAYFRADNLSLAHYGISTIADLEALTRATYSTSLSNSLISTKLGGVNDGDGGQTRARYYQKNDALGNPECIMVYKNAEVFLKDRVEYDYSSIRASHSKEDFVYVSINVTVTNPEGLSRTDTMYIELYEEEFGFRINAPTYKRYIDEGYYEQLDKNEIKK